VSSVRKSQPRRSTRTGMFEALKADHNAIKLAMFSLSWGCRPSLT
jgi:hypothetical protein